MIAAELRGREERGTPVLPSPPFSSLLGPGYLRVQNGCVHLSRLPVMGWWPSSCGGQSHPLEVAQFCLSRRRKRRDSISQINQRGKQKGRYLSYFNIKCFFKAINTYNTYEGTNCKLLSESQIQIHVAMQIQ